VNAHSGSRNKLHQVAIARLDSSLQRQQFWLAA
jgi:hypothetical protein